MLKWTLGLLLGCTLVIFLPAPLSNFLNIVLVLTVSFIGFFLYKIKRTKDYTQLKTLLLFIGSFLIGLVWASFHAKNLLDKRISYPTNHSLHIIEANIVTIPAVYKDYLEFLVLVDSNLNPELDNKRIKLKWYTNYYRDKGPYVSENIGKKERTERKLLIPKLGESWKFEIKLKPIHGQVNIAGYDIERLSFEKQIDGQGYIRNNNAELIANTEYWSIDNLRTVIYQQLNHFSQRGLFQALLIGEKINLSKEHYQVNTKLGLNHLFAISGLHISIVAGFAFFLMRFVWALCPILTRKITPLTAALVFSIISAFLYSALAGFSLPTLRALIMWCCVALGILNNQKISISQSLLFALSLILLFFPLSVFLMSFWLSFSAIVVICFIVYGAPLKGNKYFQMLKIQFCLSSMMIFIGLLFFQKASLVSLIVNMIAIPVFSLIMLPMIFIGLILQTILNSSILLNVLNASFANFYNFMKNILLEPWAASLFVEADVPEAILVIGIVFLVVSFIPLPKVRFPTLVALAMLLLSSAIHHYGLGDDNKKKRSYKMIVFDVGHGLSILFYNSKHAVLYDTGFATENTSAIQMYVLPSLRKMGINKIDLLFLSHSDNDHSGGYQELLKEVTVKTIITNNLLHEDSIRHKNNEPFISPCKQGQQWQLGLARIAVLHPKNDLAKEKVANNDSCVIRVEIDKISVLVTGDIEKEAEYLLAVDTKLSNQLSSDILLAPHHGSKTSSTYPFIKKVLPDVVVFSTDKYSRYNMPHHSVTRRYKEFGVKQINIGEAGQLTYFFLDNKWFRQRNVKRIWRNQVETKD